jgi:hypothetical protein
MTLEVLAQAAWWVGQQDTASEAWERAYTLHARSGDKVAAANAAAQLASSATLRGRPNDLDRISRALAYGLLTALPVS